MRRRIWCLLLTFCLLLTACGGKKELSLRGDELLAVGENICSWQEAQIFILAQYAKYTSVYGKEIWQVQLSEGSFADYIKDGLLEYLKLLFLADYGAKNSHVKLSDAEQASVVRAAKAYMEALGTDGAAQTGITEEIATNAFTRFARAQIFYRQTITDGQVEVSDEEARVIRLQIVELEQRVGYARIREIQDALVEGKSVSELLRGIDGAESRRAYVKRGDLPAELEAIAYELKKDKWSPAILSGTKYYLVQCLSPYEKEETAKHKAEMEKSVRDDNLRQVLENLASHVQLVYNPDLWKGWKMEQFENLPLVNFYDYSGELEK